MEVQETGEVDPDPSTVTLSSDGILSRTELVFPNNSDVFSEADGTASTATYITAVPLHFLENDGVNDTVPVAQNFLLKSLDGNTILLDTSQIALLTGGTCLFILNSTDICTDGKLTKSRLLSELGIAIGETDLTALEESGDILAVSLDESPHIQVSGANNDISFSIANSVPASELVRLEVPAVKPKRGPGRPRKDESEVDPPIGKGPYICEICGKEFPKWSQMKRHVKLHSDDKPFACPQCPMSFNVETNLKLHMVTHAPDNLVCPECNKKFSRVASMKAHIMIHEKEESLFCIECGDEFSTQVQLDAHAMEHKEEWIKSMHSPKMYQCRLCHHCFSRASFLKEHMKDHYKVKACLSHKSHKKNIDRSTFVHKCDTCSKYFQKPSQLIRHKRIHTGERPYKCDLCPRAFNQKGSLQIHMSKHNGLKPYTCEFCSAAFSQKGNLRAHIVRVHNIPRSGEQIFKCSECSCGFRKLGSLNAHMSRMHYAAEQKVNSQVLNVNITTIMPNIPTSQTGLDSSDKVIESQGDSDILQQALVNSGLSGKEQTSNSEINIGPNDWKTAETDGSTVITAPPLAGDAPKVVARQRGSLGTDYVTLADKSYEGAVRRLFIRQRRVGNVRWHQCSYCSKEFKKPSDLVRHIRTHTHEKPYKCSHCFRSFAVKSTLTAHVRTHTGVKEFSCFQCEKKFSSASSLKVHIRLHTGNKPFQCEHCNKAFRTAGHRKSHILSHDRDIICGRYKKKNQESQANTQTLPPIKMRDPILITADGIVQQQQQVTLVHKEEQGGERPHKCTSCSASFRRANDLKLHTRFHTGEKPFKCEQCDKCFVKNSSLKQHLQSHSGLKAHKCSVCTSTFSSPGSLKRHEMTHSDVRPYMCPYCQKTFKTSFHCRKHMVTHRQEIALQAAQEEKAGKETNSVPTASLSEINSSTFTADELPTELTQAFTDQTFAMDSSEQHQSGETNFAQNSLVQTLTEGDLGESTSLQPEGIITHTLHADASGTITLPALSGRHSLSQESISEIERTLNEQIFGTADGSLGDANDTTATLTITSDPVSESGVTVSMPGDVDNGNSGPIDDCTGAGSATNNELAQTLGAVTASSSENQEPLIEELVLASGQQNNPQGTDAKEDGNTQIFEATFEAQSFENCVFSSITLQGDPLSLETLSDGATITTSMAAILPSSHTTTESSAIRSEAFVEGTSVALNTESLIGHEEEEQLISVDDNDENINVDGNDDSVEVGCAEKGENDIAANGGQNVIQEEDREQRRHSCTICGSTFKKIFHLKAHMVSCSGEKLFACELCDQKCGTSRALKIHMRVHSEEQDYECEICDVHFSTKSSWAKHMVVHSDRRPYKCSMCKAGFRTDALLQRHLKVHEHQESKDDIVSHNTMSEPRGRRRADVIKLSAEETNVLAQQPLDSAASVSEKVLISSVAEKDRISELKDPQDRYQDEPLFPNQCKYCPKSFRKPSDLVRHVRIHTGERPYRCSFCGKCFTVKSTLDSHWKTHSGEKPCTCHVCQRSFATKGSLKVHMRLHTGAKPFKCPLCEMRFRTSGHRKAHLTSHMKDSARGNVFHNGRKRRKLSPADAAQKKGEEEENAPAITQITLDASALANLLPLMSGDGLSLTSGADGTSLVNNLQLQLPDSFQITGLDGALLATQSLQLDESLLQQLQQASNIIIHTLPNVSEEPNDGVENSELNQQSEDNLEDVGSLRYEVHTDETGQFINIQPASGGDVENVIFSVGDDVEMQVVGDTDASLALADQQLTPHFHVTDSLKGGRSLVAVGGSAKKDRREEAVVDDDFLVFHDCETCGKRFSKPSQLERHNRIHTGERPFECTLCQKRFNQKNALITHLKSHTGERPYACPHCDYSFTQKGNLKTHVRRAHCFSFLELSKPGKSLLKMKQPSMTICSPDTGNALEQVVCDLFPQVKTASLSDTEDPSELC